MKLYKTIDYSISIYILMLHSYINAFTCKGYVVSTYHSTVSVFNITDTYRIRNTPSTDPDWEGTATERTIFEINYFSNSSIYILKVLYLSLIIVLSNINPLFNS